MGTTWRQHGDNMRTMWRQHEDHGDVETTWGQHEDNLDLIEIIQFCLKIYDLLTHPHLWVVGWMVGLICGSMGGGQVISIKNQINLELIEIIQFYLKICDLLKHSHLWVGV